MTNKKDYFNKCFSPNWIEVDLETVDRQSKEVNQTRSESYNNVSTENMEVRLENRRRKDLNTLLKELDEIKQNIEKAAEKQHRLANLMGFYSGEFAQ
jgi:hypothetical protein